MRANPSSPRHPRKSRVHFGVLKKVSIFTDGACHRNPGPGAWAAILQYGGIRKEIVGGEPATTNNRMELTAAIEALGLLKQKCEVKVFTDSEYLRDGITKWIRAWKARGWKKKIKNKDLWLRLDEVASKHAVSWHWVRGHAGHPENERCDVLATAETHRIKQTHTPQQLAAALALFTEQQAGIPEDPPVEGDRQTALLE